MPGYFETLGIELLEGRSLRRKDRSQSLPVVVVTQSFAARFTEIAGADRALIGHRLKLDPENPDEPWRTVVGVVEDASMGWLDQDVHTGIYTPHLQTGDSNVAFLFTLRSGSDLKSENAETLLRGEVGQLDRDIPVVDLLTWPQYIDQMTFMRRLITGMYTALAIAAAILALIGIYSVMSFAVSLRRHEMGMRLALGALPSKIIEGMLRPGMLWMLIGLALGLLAAIRTTDLISGHLYGVDALDPWAFAVAALVIAVLVMLSCLLPALRASRIDPNEVLREE